LAGLLLYVPSMTLDWEVKVLSEAGHSDRSEP